MGNVSDGGQSIGMDEDMVAITSRKIATAAEDVHMVHRTTRQTLDDSGSGHVGSTAQALSELSQRWAATGQRHTQHLDTLSRGVGNAGITLTNTNEDGAREIADIPND
ncbi:hypothetical protein A5662_12580 [Mycobacteriaceae bacterium 1482268.1]|nr:hypothetical protein A5662_12580 [Mycobacteriaceae bacterium 1482268.1]